MTNRRHYIYNYAFITSLILLALNDHLLKGAFGNAITGKLSDFAGMVILPLLLVFVFPKLKNHVLWLSAILFAFWKSPLSTPLINWYNTFALIDIERVVDYTDLAAFAALPLPYFIINKEYSKFLQIENIRLSPIYLVIPCIFLLMATSPPKSYYYTQTTGNLRFYNTSLKVRLTRDGILDKLHKNGIEPLRDMSVDTTRWPRYRADKNAIHYYKVPQIIFDKDTLENLEFSFEPDGDKTRIYLNGITIEKDLSDEKVEKKLRKYFRKAAKKYFKQTLRE
ncbi:hypothetical protein OGH69_03405 [Flavobacterium sp. MFBS3-15]|uniref:hypothetical protein n=1 Tax=Flavobacterium sp. MFBS3-15 TaxID=2989816 RepID=UPI002236200E|nr:hypothetical protein [Flavobacterium sp. MFBS3-15]MCW4468001.1 hypothetical protein [Flavobacterium sp. MFBS3-15]